MNNQIKNAQYLGLWEVIESSHRNPDGSTYLKDSCFELVGSNSLIESRPDRHKDLLYGSIIWHNKYNAENSKLLTTEIFYYTYKEGGRLNFLGNEFGSSFEFSVKYETDGENGQTMTLTDAANEGLPFITCKRKFENSEYEPNFNFKNLFNSIQLSDIKVNLSNGVVFNAHSSILKLTLHENVDSFLNKFHVYNTDPSVVELILYFCYTNKLLMNEETLNRIVHDELSLNEFTSLLSNNNDALNYLAYLVKNYKNLFDFKQLTKKSVEKINVCIQNIAKCFSSENEDVGVFSTPVELCKQLRVALEQIFIVGFEILLLFQVYHEIQREFSFDSCLSYIEFLAVEVVQTLVPTVKNLLTQTRPQVDKLGEDQKKNLFEHLAYEIKFIRNFILELKKEAMTSIKVMEKKYEFQENENIFEKEAAEKNQANKILSNSSDLLFDIIFANFELEDHISEDAIRSFFDQLTTYTIPSFLDKLSNLNEMRELGEFLNPSIHEGLIEDRDKVCIIVQGLTYELSWFAELLRKKQEHVEPILSIPTLVFQSEQFQDQMLQTFGFSDSKKYLHGFEPAKIEPSREAFLLESSVYYNRIAAQCKHIYKSNESDLNDFKIEIHDVKGESEIVYVNGVILAARSNWFYEQIKANADSKIVNCQVKSIDIGEKVLEYLCTGRVESLEPNQQDDFRQVLKEFQ